MINPYTFPQNGTEGATLLDLFAALAMEKLIEMYLTQTANHKTNYDEIARKAYSQGRAMIEERENWVQ